MILSRSRSRVHSKGKVFGGGGSAPSSLYFTDNALTNQYYNDDALANKRIFADSSVLLGPDTVIAVLGDSQEQHQVTGAINTGSAELSYWSRNAINWARMFDPRGRMVNWYDANVTNRISNGFNKGVSGNDTAAILARVTDITNIPNVKVCIVGGGTNDISTTTTSGNAAARYTAAITNLRATYDALLAANIKIIILSIAPRNIGGANGWASGSAARQLFLDICTWMQAQADADPTRIQIVRRDLLMSTGDADRTPITGYIQSDDVHITPMGGAAVALNSGGLVEKLANWVAPFTEFPPAVALGDIATNPTCSGTAGTLGTATTGVVCDGMRGQRSSGSTGVTCVASKETVGGIDYQKLVFTCDGLAVGGTNTTYLFDKPSNITSPLPKPGTWMQGFMQFKADASPLFEGISLRPRGQPSTPANMDSQAMKTDNGNLWPNIALNKADGSPLWQATPQFQLKDGTTSILWHVAITINNQTAGTATVWISRMHLIPVPDPTIEF